jgi:hypothetical protein
MDRLKEQQQKVYALKEEELRKWIESELGYPLQGSTLQTALMSGVDLCKLIQKFCGETAVPRINPPEKGAFKQKENIMFFTRACEDLGMNRKRVFDVNDLYEKRNMAKGTDIFFCFEDC